MKTKYMRLAASLREGSYIMEGNSVVGFRRPTENELKAADVIESLAKCMDVTDRSWRLVVDELNAYKELGTIEHIRELVEAEQENRLKIKPVRKYATCGSCKSFIRTEGEKYGICLKRQSGVSGNFSVLYGSRKACAKDYVPRGDESDVAK